MKKSSYEYEIYPVEGTGDHTRVWAVDSIAAAYTFAYLCRNNMDVIFQRPEYVNLCTFKIGSVKYICEKVKA